MPFNISESLRAAYPIEQSASCADFERQEVFARHAQDLLPDYDGVLFKATRSGLLMLGQTEADLAAPGRLLRELFGKRLNLSPPHVWLAYADGWQQPIMGFRVATQVSDLTQVRRSLERRGARISHVELGRSTGVIRGQAPLIDLIGYTRTLSRESHDTGEISVWLSHHEPLWSYTSETMACYAE